MKLWTLVQQPPRLRSSPTTSTLTPALGEQKLQCLRVVGEVLQVTVLWDKLVDEEDGDYHSRGAFDPV